MIASADSTATPPTTIPATMYSRLPRMSPADSAVATPKRPPSTSTEVAISTTVPVRELAGPVPASVRRRYFTAVEVGPPPGTALLTPCVATSIRRTVA
jgi:hypothetical protein